MKLVKKILLALLVIFVIAQFFGPEKNEGDLASVDTFIADTTPPESVQVILKETCYDCHSSFTRYPWYNNITPVNYWMDEHIEHGRKHLDFSSWEGYSVKKKDHKMEELIEMVEEKEMPLPSYTWTHGDANLTDEQISEVIKWAEQVRFKYSLVERPQ
ncbi:heme-binding domain-containing protein [Mangrovimonas aestuarii]|uniref:heme-binding domain-containing protein n=1 Tax=Mangrovimonas aestuarii TaxID=3018443 RepID=UPI0023784DF5|nr:heme-binding domain-containing protein [Mangrovimonas aestuarii]